MSATTPLTNNLRSPPKATTPHTVYHRSCQEHHPPWTTSLTIYLRTSQLLGPREQRGHLFTPQVMTQATYVFH